MTSFYNNIPIPNGMASNLPIVQTTNQYWPSPIELNNSELMAMTAFFQKRGFSTDAAESTAVIIMQQAYKDRINAMKILDTLSGLNSAELSALVGEILNYNRLKTSSLGISQQTIPSDFITRNILA
jgi:hypothetical protein